MVGVTGGTRFYLGAHHANWLARVDVPLFVSHRRLAELGPGALPRARGPWALDSGAFSEIAEYGQFRTSPQQYADAVRRYADQVGRLEWAAPQDWMCEPVMLAKTGLTIAKHQRRTVANYLELRALAPEVPFIPVLQGWTTGDYLTCVDLYQAAGVDLAGVPVVGLGSVCRRQATAEIGDLVATLAGLGLRLHGFGVKRLGLARYGHLLASADSMAWSAQHAPARLRRAQELRQLPAGSTALPGGGPGRSWPARPAAPARPDGQPRDNQSCHLRRPGSVRRRRSGVAGRPRAGPDPDDCQRSDRAFGGVRAGPGVGGDHRAARGDRQGGWAVVG